MKTIILASASPRRRELLAQIGVDCDVIPADIDETVRHGESPIAYTQRMAREKCATVRAHVSSESIVLAADTSVCLEQDIFGKPVDRRDAMSMLEALRAREHQVVTSFALAVNDCCVVESCTTRVWMTAATTEKLDAYWRSGEPVDKAGAYAIQGLGAALVERIDGSYSNVVGLPLFEVGRALQSIGFDPVVNKNN